ncbi:MAG: SDR family oxidoreductase [Rikenellaceae bacterium]
MKILVTGGAGFIGSNLSERLLGLGYEVVCLDNFSTGNRRNILAMNLSKHYKLIEGDIRSLETCHKATEGVDYVLHHAALGSVPRSLTDPITANEVNVSGFLNMLTASRDAKVKRFIYAASSSTYGDSTKLPKIEEEIGKPLSPYAVTKYANELYADVFSRCYGLQTIGLRYFNVFGAKQDPMGSYAAVIPLFTKQLISHQSPTINGNGEFSRDFTHIDNVIEANLKAIETTNPEAINQVYNIAFGESTTLNKLVEYLKESLCSYDSEISKITPTYREPRAGDIPHSLASTEKAQHLLDFTAKVSVREGLRKAAEWYWYNLKRE